MAGILAVSGGGAKRLLRRAGLWPHAGTRSAALAGAHLRSHRQEPPMPYAPINLAEKFALFTDRWQPRVVAEMNELQFKIVRLEGDFLWHHHPETDEAFLVLEGTLRLDFRDGAVRLGPGEMFVVPRGVEHKPCAEGEVKLMLIEPRGILNTGHEGGERTAANDVWI
ncbi:cupin domain-containing protein [Inquilinus limosus]|nr:cupin domain-containing protein [Inquilinus limosus]